MFDIGIEIKEFNGEGYMPLVKYDGWRVAIINSSDKLLEKNICKIERHLTSDEVFVLLEGNSNLYIGESLKKIQMEVGKIYNVKCGEWHCISMDENTKVAIVENHDVGDENSEYRYYEKGGIINV